MSTFWGLVVYMAIGGFVITPAVVAMDEQCGTQTTIQTYAAAAATWPAFAIAAAFFADGDGVTCAAKKEDAK